MNRSIIELLFYKEKSVRSELKDLCKRVPLFFSAEPVAPEFILQEKLEFAEMPPVLESSKKATDSLVDTVTTCSNSFPSVNFKNIYNGVFQSRTRHSPLSELEKEADEAIQWHYFEEKSEKILGPFSSFEMDQRFKWGVLKEKTLVRTQKEEKYKMFSSYIKIYISKLQQDRVPFVGGARRMSNRMLKFMKVEDLLRKESMSDSEEPVAREERVRSHTVRPNLTELAACMADSVDEDSENVSRSGRFRVSTLQPFKCS
jgi:hypothetical protein